MTGASPDCQHTEPMRPRTAGSHPAARDGALPARPPRMHGLLVTPGYTGRMAHNRSQGRTRRNWTTTFLLVGSGFLFLWAINLVVAIRFEQSSLYGDALGMGNALFSGLAIAGVVVTLLMQKEALELQRRDLRLQRKEFKKATRAHKKRNRFEAKVHRTRTTMDMLTEWDELHAQSLDTLIRVLRPPTQEGTRKKLGTDHERALSGLLGYLRKVIALKHNKAVDADLWGSHLDAEMKEFFDDLLPKLEHVDLPWRMDQHFEALCDELRDMMAKVNPMEYGRDETPLSPPTSTPSPTLQSAGSHPAG